MKKHCATKKTNPRSFVIYQDLQQPGLENFFGREGGMHELANIAKPHFEDIIRQQRKQAVDAINKTKADFEGQYDKALTQRTKKITVATTGTFLKALKLQDDAVLEGSRMASLYSTGTLLHHYMSCPTSFCCSEETWCYFPNKNCDEGKTQREIGYSFTSIKLKVEQGKDQGLTPQPAWRPVPYRLGE